MERHIDDQLEHWAQSPSRKPLLLFGARQVGKTYAVKKFASSHYDSFAFLDFSRDTQIADIFNASLNPAAIIGKLEIYLDMDIAPGKTLLFFDEVQLCERALTSLKYFCDDAPQYHVIAAGSLLGVKVNREIYSFPVGKVDTITLHPMDFEEFLWARGKKRLSNAIREETDRASHSNDFAFHNEAMDLVREYYLVGGMPEAVRTYCSNSNDLLAGANRARKIIQIIDQAYLADMTKYTSSSEAPRIFEAWRSIPSQLAKENHKFQYAKVRSGGRANQYEGALSWLESAGIVTRCTQVSDGIAPLRQFENPTAFKLYMADTGILSEAFDAHPSDFLPKPDKAAAFRGGIAENYVLQQLVSKASVPHYWGTASKSEVEFIARSKGGDVIPIEVKSGSNVRANSLMAYRDKYHPPYVVRFSSRKFGYDNEVLSLPLYAATFFAETLE